MGLFCSIFILVSLLCWLLISAAPNSTSIYFSYITSITGAGFRSGGARPVVDLALEQINNNTDILPNYTLSYRTIRDSKCDVTASLNAFNEDFVDVKTEDQNKSDPTFLTLLCCGCSTATIPVAEISHYWNIPHMAFDAAAAVLTDRNKFRNFFRTLPQYEFLPRAILRTTLEFKWTQMAVITQTENLFTSITDELTILFEQRGWSLDTSINIKSDSEPFSHEAAFALKGDYRIIFINAYPNFAFALLCQAYYRSMLAPKYVWITPSWYQENWWKSTVNKNCTPEIMKQVVNGSLAISPSGFFPLENDTAITTSEMSPSEYKRQYDIRLNDTARYQNLTKVDIAGTAFDAIWAIALGLHNASERVRMNDSSGCEDYPGELVPLEKFNYRNKMMGCVILRSMGNVTLAGITGKIAFNENGSRIDDNDIVLHQYRITGDSRGLMQKIVANLAILTNSSSFTFAKGENANTIWAGGAPYDGSAVDAVHRNHLAMEIIYSTLATAGLVFTVVCFVFNLLFRNTKIVKLSSPNLNYLIIIGAGFLYISVYMYVFVADRENIFDQTVLCNLREWLSSIGYDICFAVILAKTWRVYYIFTNPQSKKKLLKDWVLLLIVIAVVSVDFIIIKIGTAVPSSRLNATLVRDSQHPTFITAEQTNINNFVYTCIGSGTVVWFAISYAYKGLLQLVAMFMAFHIRRVKIKALNDSKEIAVIIYINSITLALLAVVEFALNAYHEVYAALLGLGIMVAATLFLALVFIPKMINLAKDPKGQSVFDDSNIADAKLNTAQLKSTESGPSNTINQNEELTKLRNRVIELEEKLAAKSI